VAARTVANARAESSTRGGAIARSSPFPWRGGPPPVASFADGFFAGAAPDVARGLLGARLVSSVGGCRTAGVIVETEAYLGPDDPASHAATRGGPTERNRAMFGPPGRAYVYRSYGMHWCMNVVTGVEGVAQAVLLRGLDPLEGEAHMAHRRRGRAPLASGPGRLCEALGVTGVLYGHDLSAPPLLLLPGWPLPDYMIEVGGRIGVRVAADWPLRYYVRGNPGVSGRKTSTSVR
jgi:DNA-3-methyladenine glycosylase